MWKEFRKLIAERLLDLSFDVMPESHEKYILCKLITEYVKEIGKKLHTTADIRH